MRIGIGRVQRGQSKPYLSEMTHLNVAGTPEIAVGRSNHRFRAWMRQQKCSTCPRVQVAPTTSELGGTPPTVSAAALVGVALDWIHWRRDRTWKIEHSPLYRRIVVSPGGAAVFLAVEETPPRRSRPPPPPSAVAVVVVWEPTTTRGVRHRRHPSSDQSCGARISTLDVVLNRRH